MITTSTVFVLGAGASVPYSFPSGGKLVDDICNASETELEVFGVNKADYGQFKVELHSSQQLSVDAFLERRTEFKPIGKTALAVHLIRCENPVSLLAKKDDNWYSYLMNRMTDSTFDDFRKNKVSFVTFNYDRSLEHYFHTSLRARYGKSSGEVEDVLRTIPIIHVYGNLGCLPWQTEDESTIRRYEPELTPETVKIAAKNIIIISETNETNPAFEEANRLMNQAERIGILGFGYHPVNMRRLHPPLNKVIWGTCNGKTKAESEHLTGYSYRGLNLANPKHKCLDFLRNQSVFQRD
jgi:hypothetical protein